MRLAIETDKLATPVGPFSIAVGSGTRLYVSGQVAQDPATGKLIAGDVTAQAEQVLRNLSVILGAAGRSLDDVTRVGIYLASMGDFPAVNAAYARFFDPPYPARTTIGVAALPLGALVEMDMIVDGG
jgi:2-iminobutanoate/2-iminopropanoate deaminase